MLTQPKVMLKQEATHRRLEIFGLSKSDSIRLTNHINDLILCNGPEWTISRLKSIKVGYIQHLAGKISKFDWIKTKNGLPSGAFKPVFSLKNPQKVLSCLMVYSSLVAAKVTKKQWNKFSKSVTKVRKNSFLIFDSELCRPSTGDSLTLGLKNQDLGSDHSIRMYQSKKRSPNYKDRNYKTVDGNGMNSIDSFGHGRARKYITTNMMDSLPSWFVKEMSKRWSTIRDVEYSLEKYDFVGRISFIQEPGFKLRAIANPLPAFQVLLEPLKQSLMGFLKNIPNDFTHNQDQGCEFVKTLISEGPVSSIDLSDATNNLPLTDQLKMLRTIYGHDHTLIKLFQDVSTSKWVVDGPDGEQFLQWNTGQPLGLGPSFPMFALYHHFIVRFAMLLGGCGDAIDDLYKEILGSKPSRAYPYAIVGDDIVMSSQYQEYYIKLIDLLECSISYDKCIFDSNMAEFCSRLITTDRIYRQYKWTPVNDKSFLDFCKQHGPASIELLKPRQRFIINQLSKIPYTLGGPLSWNPEGKPLAVRENEWWKVAEALLSVEDTSNSVPRDRLHYDLKKQLGLIQFRNDYLIRDIIFNSPDQGSVSEEDIAPIRSIVESILRLYEAHGRDSKFVSDNVKRNLIRAVHEEGINITSAKLTDLEREALNWIHEPFEGNGQQDNDPWMSKMFRRIKSIL